MAPENTHASFALAAALGANYLELDVHSTADGTIVVLHDPTLERTTSGSGTVGAARWADVANLDAGYHYTVDGKSFPYRGHGVRIPTLESVLQQFPAHRFNIEIKQAVPSIVDSVLEVTRRTGSVDRVLLAAEQDAIMREIRVAGGGQLATGSSTGEVVEFMQRLEDDDWDRYLPAGGALQIPVSFGGRELVTSQALAAAHRLGCEIHAWTINDEDEIERLLDLGVDGIMSDFPGLAFEVVRR